MIKTVVSAHRGDIEVYRENTLMSVVSALSLDIGYIEVDLRLTSDNVPVLLHDQSLKRLWNVDKNIEDTSWDELLSWGDTGNRPPSLVEVLDIFKSDSHTLLLDVTSVDIAVKSFEVLNKYPEAKTAWCGDFNAMFAIRELDSSAEVWCPAVNDILNNSFLNQLKPQVLNFPYMFLSKDLVEKIHDHGYRICAWTVDSLLEQNRMRDFGVDIITTNYPRNLIDLISQHDHPVLEKIYTEISKASPIVDEIAKEVMVYHQQNRPTKVQTKANQADLVTDVDLAVEQFVRDKIFAQFPDHIFVGEEQGGSFEPDRFCWFLDPVDGTTNFANNIPFSSFSLSLTYNKDPLVSVVFDPWRNDIFKAVYARGALLNELPLKINIDDPVTLEGGVVLTELAAHKPWVGMTRFLEGLANNFATMRIMGSGTLTLTGIADRRGNSAVVNNFNPIDHMAAVHIVRESGGIILDEIGNMTLYPKEGGILVSHPKVAHQVHKIWLEAITEE